jgi:hypothetical protein
LPAIEPARAEHFLQANGHPFSFTFAALFAVGRGIAMKGTAFSPNDDKHLTRKRSCARLFQGNRWLV